MKSPNKQFPKNPNKFSTIVELLHSKALQHPERKLFTYLLDGELDEVQVTYGELDRQARAVGALLQGMGLEGKGALPFYYPGLELMAANYGTQYAGMVLVCTYPPDPTRLAETLPQFLKNAKDSQANVILTSSSILAMIEPLSQLAPELKDFQWIATDNIPADTENFWKPPSLSQDDLAVLQYTSGSTGNPKGVMVSHRNIMDQLIAGGQIIELSPESLSVSWLPLYHTLGQGPILQTILTSGSLILMSPLSFLEKPVRWLQAISRYRGKISMGPNFAYDLCVQQITSEQKSNLDLSSWEIAAFGSEPIRADTIDRFVSTFAPYGFRKEAFMVGYGLTETTFMISTGVKKDPPIVKSVFRDAIQQNRVVESPPGTNGSQWIVSSGRPIPGLRALIVDPVSLTQCQPNQIGEIWVSGAGICKGYWNRPKETEETFKAYVSDTGEGPFLRTGDLGFQEGEILYITGRFKDLIIIRGQNHYPHDIEQTAQKSHEGVRVGSGAAFSIEIDDEERLVLVQEVDHSESLNIDQVIRHIRESISRTHGIQVFAISLLKPGSISKTRNNKVERKTCKTQFLNGNLDQIAEWKENLTNDLMAECEGIQPPRVKEDIGQWLVSNISKFLKVPTSEINISRSLTSYGIDSLSAVRLASEIENNLGIPILIATLFESSSIEIILEELKNQFKSPPPEGVFPTIQLDLNSEAILDPSISFETSLVKPSKEPNSIFLTGSTGFVGTFLLQELLEKTRAEIYCLVRAKNKKEGAERIQKSLEFFSLWKESYRAKIIPVLGDMTKKNLGVPSSEFKILAENIDEIFHCGAVVNFVYSYRDLKATNVLGTEELLRLAGQKKLKSFHYVSTISVFPVGAPHPKTIFEEDDLVETDGLLNGYAQSKWVAERLVAEARSRGLPVNIHRVGEVIGHSQTGMCRATQDAFSLILKGCIQLGIVPEINHHLNIVPVDYVVQAIVHLSKKTTSLGKVFHLTNQRPIKFSQLYDFINANGYQLSRIPHEEWIKKVLRIIEMDRNNPLTPFIPLLKSKAIENLFKSRNDLILDHQNTVEGLHGAPIACPENAVALLKPHLSYLIQTGFLSRSPNTSVVG